MLEYFGLGSKSVSSGEIVLEKTTHPLNTFCQLFFFLVRKPGVKLEFKNYAIHFMDPELKQAWKRARDGVSHKDLNSLDDCLKGLCEMYPPNEFPQITKVFELAVLGLEVLRNKSYGSKGSAQKIIDIQVENIKACNEAYKAAQVTQDRIAVIEKIEKTRKKCVPLLLECKKGKNFEKKLDLLKPEIVPEGAANELLSIAQEMLNYLDQQNKEFLYHEQTYSTIKVAKDAFKDIFVDLGGELDEGQEIEDEMEKIAVNPFKTIWSKEDIDEFILKATFIAEHIKNENPEIKIKRGSYIAQLEAIMEGKLEMYRHIFKENATQLHKQTKQ